MDPFVLPPAVVDPTDPTAMPPEARLAEIASILAEAVLRLKSRSALGLGGESPTNRLEECGEQSVHAPVG